MFKLYLVPGIAADTRVFNKLDLKNNEIIRCEWTDPNYTNNLQSYAQLIVKQYNIEAGSIIIGNFLGGMIAVEIAQIIPVKLLVLISSIKISNQEPAYFSFFRKFPLYRYLPVKAFLEAGLAFVKLLNLMPAQDVMIFKSMVAKSNDQTMRWGIHASLTWQNTVVPRNLTQINGDHDLVFPVKRIKNAFIIKNGTHLMVYDRAFDINEILSGLLPS